MALPDFQSCMYPLLAFLKDGKERTIRDSELALADHFQLSDKERLLTIPSGQRVFVNRLGWARTYLKNAGLIDSPQRGVFKITDRGTTVLQGNLTRIDIKFLEQFPEFLQFRQRSATKTVVESDSDSQAADTQTEGTPEESIESAYQGLRNQLAQEILGMVLSCSPAFFEQLVVDLLVKMGYGGSRQDAGERLGQTGDGGIDGIIKEDRLGLDTIYIQAKRWQGSVGRPEIQKFVGALAGRRARKGVFLTTSTYTTGAIDYIKGIDMTVILIDGTELSNLMIDFGVGVSDSATYVLKRIDSDYFEDA